MGITETLNITNNEYNTCLILFYVGCEQSYSHQLTFTDLFTDVITQVPSNLIIGKVRPSIYICLITSAWGVVSMCQGFTTDFTSLAVTRTILGLVEGMDIYLAHLLIGTNCAAAPFLPGVFFLMSTWYKRTELPIRVAILYVSIGRST